MAPTAPVSRRRDLWTVRRFGRAVSRGQFRLRAFQTRPFCGKDQLSREIAHLSACVACGHNPFSGGTSRLERGEREHQVDHKQKFAGFGSGRVTRGIDYIGVGTGILASPTPSLLAPAGTLRRWTRLARAATGLVLAFPRLVLQPPLRVADGASLPSWATRRDLLPAVLVQS